MINLFRKTNFNKQHGAAMLAITIILLMASTLIIIFAANQGKILTDITANQSRNRQAMQAALAGMEYGINYLLQNSSVILANPVNGYIPAYTSSNTTNVTQANGSTYSITYTNPVAYNYNLIKITSTGTSDDGTATRVASQEVQFGSLIAYPPTIPLTVQNNVVASGNVSVTNEINNNTIEIGGTIIASGNFKTILNSGTSSTTGNYKSDIQQNVSSLANMTESGFFTTYFGSAQSTVQGKMANTYSSGGNYSSTLNGMTGTSIWINGSANFSGNATIGSAASPVLLIVNGSLNMSGTTTIYGFVFVVGSSSSTNISGNTTVTGGLVSMGSFNASGNTNVTYSNTVLSTLQSQSSGYYAKVPGTWKDF